jgi:ferredoxin
VYRIEIDRSLCSGFGSCAEAAPGAVAVDHDGIAVAVAPQTADGRVLDAAASCPMGAIAVYDATGAQVA